MGLDSWHAGTTTTSTSTEEPGDWVFSIAGYQEVRARISDYSAGTITVKGYATVLTMAAVGGGGGASSDVNVIQIAGTSTAVGNGTANSGTQRVAIASDNTAFATICSGAAKGGTSAANATVTSVDSDHNALDVYVRGGGGGGGNTTLIPGTTATYISSDSEFTPGGSATDIWTLFGSNSKTIKVLYVGLRYTGNTVGYGTFFLLRRSSANSGGTSTSTTPAKMTSSNAAASATIKCYTANPSSLGTGDGQLASLFAYPLYVSGGVTNLTSNSDSCMFDYRLVGQPITLSGTSEGIAVNCNGTSPTGGTVKISIRAIFTEE